MALCSDSLNRKLSMMTVCMKEKSLDTAIPQFTVIITTEGNSFPAAGCRIASVIESAHDNTSSWELRLISISGTEFPIEKRSSAGWAKSFPPTARMTSLRDLITNAIKAGERILDLRDIPSEAEDSPISKQTATT